jgi:hypothetical protein
MSFCQSGVDVRNPIMLIEILKQQSFGFAQCSDLNPVKRLITLSYYAYGA